MDLNIFRKKAPKKGEQRILGLEKKHAILFFSVAAAAVLGVTAFLVAGPKMYGLFFGLAVTVGFVPYSLYSYSKQRRIRDIEDNFPALLRDIAESRKSGMTLPQAVYKSARIDYGALSPDVKRMANQISWGVPLASVAP